MKRKGYLLISLGTVFVIAAALMLYYNHSLERDAQVAADEVVPELIKQIEQNQEENTQNGTFQNDNLTQPKQTDDSEGIEIDNHHYMGVLTIQSLQLQLPILADYRYGDLRIAPCRYWGNPSTNMVIAAHNYKTHFGNINRLSEGEPISFIDKLGVTYHYKVALVEELEANARDKILSKDWDLTLFTCNYMGDKRITVRCSKVKDQSQ